MAGTQENNAVPWADLDAYRAAYRAEHPLPAPDQVVTDLAEKAQWVIWRYEPGERQEAKPRKIPYYPRGGKRFGAQGSDKDKAALGNYALAAEMAVKRGFDGVGFAFLPGDGLIGIDLDGMIDPASGEISDLCQGIIQACASYTELSPSGKGVHIICSGELESFKSNKIGVEVFCGRQFFTFTGRRWPGGPDQVNPLPAAAAEQLRAMVDEAKGGSHTPAPAREKKAGATLGGRQRSLAETVALAEEAIKSISPDDYQTWINVGMACKEGLGHAGYLIWDQWSSESPKYRGADDTAARWKTFSPKEITLGKLFGLAQDGGWEAPWEKAKRKRAKKPALPPPPEDDVPPLGEVTPPAVPMPEPAETISTAKEAHAGESDPGLDLDIPDDSWQDQLVRRKGDITPCLANAELILRNMNEWRGLIGYDQFSERTVFRGRLPFDPDGPETGDWSDELDVATAIWLQRKWWVEFSDAVVGKAVEAVSKRNRFHPVQERLASLAPWDGRRRNRHWLSDYLGVNESEYTQRVGEYFLRGMIKRVMEPGSKFDYCLVLEGDQGRGKSSACRILAWDWYCDTDLDLNNKDALLALPGHLVYEIAEMGSLMKAEERRQKSFLSRQEDEFRPPYGKRMIKVKRQNVFIGTTNEEEYLKDPTGARRFWPVMCGEVFNLDGLREALPMMYAEALADYRAGEPAFPTRDEEDRLFRPEQVKRGMPEPFQDLLAVWVDKQVSSFTMADAATDGLGMTADKLTPAVCTRVGMALRKLGCGREEHRTAANPQERRKYIPPSLMKNDPLTRPTSSSNEKSEGDYVQF